MHKLYGCNFQETRKAKECGARNTDLINSNCRVTSRAFESHRTTALAIDTRIQTFFLFFHPLSTHAACFDPPLGGFFFFFSSWWYANLSGKQVESNRNRGDAFGLRFLGTHPSSGEKFVFRKPSRARGFQNAFFI